MYSHCNKASKWTLKTESLEEKWRCWTSASSFTVKLYSWDISGGMEGRSVNIYNGARIPEMMPLVSQRLHFCLENRQFQISLKTLHFQICSCSPQKSFLSVASALYWRESNYDFVLVSLSDVIFVYLPRLNSAHRKMEMIWRGRYVKTLINPIIAVPRLNIHSSPGNELWPGESSCRTHPENISHYSPAISCPAPGRCPPPTHPQRRKIDFSLEWVLAKTTMPLKSRAACVIFPLAFRGIFWQAIPARLR